MTELAEKLAEKYTRGEIEEMAQKLGIITAGISKLKIAEAVIEARKKVPAAAKPRVKEAKAKVEPMRAIGSNGVFALQADMARKAVDMESFASELHTSSMDMYKKGAMEMQKGINAQIKWNEKGAAKMESGVKELHDGIVKMRKDFEKKSLEMQKGVMEIHRGIEEIQNNYKEFHNDTMEYIKDFYYG